jgi:hypothetical protein
MTTRKPPRPLSSLTPDSVAVLLYLRRCTPGRRPEDLMVDALERARAISMSVPRLLPVVQRAEIVLLPEELIPVAVKPQPAEADLPLGPS